MKKLLAASLLTAGVAFAQSGIAGGKDGLHQYNANTMGQWHFELGTGGNVSLDNWSLAKGGVIKDAKTGKDFGVYEIDGSFAGNFNFSMGLFNWMDIGFNQGLNYDYVGSATGLEDAHHMTTIGLGDFEGWVKFALPFTSDSSVMSFGAIIRASAAIGETASGVRPRHAWYVGPGGFTEPYTANGPTIGADLIMTADWTKRGIPLRWNTQVGFIFALEEDYPNALTYSTGLNWFIHPKVDAFLEYNGEMRVSGDDAFEFMTDPNLITPGFRFHLSRSLDLGVGLEVALRNVKNPLYKFSEEMKDADKVVIHRYGERGEHATYGYASTALYAGAATLVYRFGGDDEDPAVLAAQSFAVDSAAQARLDSLLQARAMREDSLARTDSDKDGIVDLKDNCPKTPEGAQVDSTGCPIDTDKDGVADGIDQCPGTAAGVAVGPDGCEADFDKDGVLDSKDQCPNTPEGAQVDVNGCPVDSDKDGVSDDKDKCPGTAAGTAVDNTGCPLDFDKDGVPDGLDKCPNTAAGIAVDSVGCSLDGDKDGVPDGLDKCPATEAGVSVDSIGCALDYDQDGVPDSKDKCPNTLPGIKVKEDGCPVRKKENLDELKKGIQFKLNSSKLTKNSYGTLDDIVKLMKQIPEANLEVQGHTDELGSDATNQKLSQDRAQAVVDYFVKKGVESSRLRAVGFGATKPIADNKDKAGREKNRRVELVPFQN